MWCQECKGHNCTVDISHLALQVHLGSSGKKQLCNISMTTITGTHEGSPAILREKNEMEPYYHSDEQWPQYGFHVYIYYKVMFSRVFKRPQPCTQATGGQGEKVPGIYCLHMHVIIHNLHVQAVVGGKCVTRINVIDSACNVLVQYTTT